MTEQNNQHSEPENLNPNQHNSASDSIQEPLTFSPTFFGRLGYSLKFSWQIWTQSKFWLLVLIAALFSAIAWSMQFAGHVFEVSFTSSNARAASRLTAIFSTLLIIWLLFSCFLSSENQKAKVAIGRFMSFSNLGWAAVASIVPLILISMLVDGNKSVSTGHIILVLSIWFIPSTLVTLLSLRIGGYAGLSNALGKLLLPKPLVLINTVLLLVLLFGALLIAALSNDLPPALQGMLVGAVFMVAYVPLASGVFVTAMRGYKLSEEGDLSVNSDPEDATPEIKKDTPTQEQQEKPKNPISPTIKMAGGVAAALAIGVGLWTTFFVETEEERKVRLAAAEACRIAAGLRQDPTHEGKSWPKTSAQSVDEKQQSYESPVAICAEALALDDDNPTLQFQLANAWLKDGDSAQSLNYLQQAADQNYAIALHFLAGAYLNGSYGIETDPQRAAELYHAGFEAGYNESLYTLFWEYIKGDKLPQDGPRAVDLYEKAVEAGNTDVLFPLAELYDTRYRKDNIPESIAPDDAKAYRLYMQAAESGDDRAFSRQLGMLKEGRGTAKDHQAAYELVQKAIKANTPGALLELGILQRDGIGTVQDYAASEATFRKAFEAGDPYGALGMAYAYEMGHGRAVDLEEASRWFFKGAEAGLEIAAIKHAELKLQGVTDGIPLKNISQLYLDYAENNKPRPALLLGRWYASQQNYFDALLAFMHASGGGAEESFAEIGKIYLFDKLPSGAVFSVNHEQERLERAKKEFERGILWGDEKANYGLGVMHFYGWGVPQNTELAVSQLRQASRAGEADASQFLNKLYTAGIANPEPGEKLASSQSFRAAVKFSEGKKNKAHKVCENTIDTMLVGHATTGDVDAACQCFERLMQIANIQLPKKHKDIFYAQAYTGTVIDFRGISSTASSTNSRLTPKVQASLDALVWEAENCFGHLTLNRWTFGSPAGWWREGGPGKSYPFSRAKPVAGPPTTINNGLHGLNRAALRPLKEAIRNSPYAALRNPNPRNKSVNELWQEVLNFQDGIENAAVLSCYYKAERANEDYNRRARSGEYFFWYKPMLDIDVEALKKAVSPENKIHTIGEPLTRCPVNKPGASI